MAVNYNRHRQNTDFSRQLGSKRNCSPKNHPENVSVEYLNNRSSPNQIHNSNSKPDQKTITITVKKKTQQKKQRTMKENMMQRVKKAKDTSLFTVCDYLKVLAKKCSTPDAYQPYVHRNQNRRCSDTCLNMSTPFKTKTVVNTVSTDPKKIPPGCKNLLNHPLMQAQFSIYRCQLNKENGACKTCNSAAIFEVVKCLYDCYKKKKCDPCKCVACGYLPKDIRKLIKEVNRSSASVGVETASTNRKTRSTMTSAEDELLSMLQNEAKPKQFKITDSEKLRMTKAFGILTPPESPGGVKIDRADQEKNIVDYMTDAEACPDVNVQFEKMLYLTNPRYTGPTLRVPSKKLRKARASGLLIPLDGKTQQQRKKLLRHLAMNDIPLPEGKTESEMQVITKVRRALGLPPGPRTAEEKERYLNAQAAGFITPLKGKTLLQKENILRSLLEYGIPLPEGRRPSEKALIEKIELERLLKPTTKSDTEKTIKHKARSYVHTLFNKFTNETGYMVLVETSCVKDKFCNLQAKGFLTPIENILPKEEANIFRLIRPKETKSLEKALYKEVEIGVRLIPESQGKTQIRKVSRRTGKENMELSDGQRLSKKFVKIQPNSRTPVQERIKSKGKLSGTAVSGNPHPNSRTSLENLLDQRVKDKARSSNVILERTGRTKLKKSESEQAKVIKGFADGRLWLTKDFVSLEKETINKVRDKPKTFENPCQKSEKETAVSQKISKDTVTKLISKLVSHIKEDLDNTRAGAAKFEKGAACDKKKLSFRNSYLTIKLSVSDVSNETTPKVTRSVFTDTKDIRHMSDIATSIPSIPNSNTTVDYEAETLGEIPTKEKKNKKNSPYNKNLTSGNSTNEDSKSAFCFNFVSDTDDVARPSQDKTNESDLEANADLIYIYKPTFEYNAKGMLETSSRIILTDYNISPATSGSLYLIETGSTDSYDSGMTDFSYATRDTSETETGTDVYYTQRSEDEHTKETSSETRIFWFYRNSIHKTSQPAGRDAKIYLVSEVKMLQQTSDQAQREKKQVYPQKRCNLHNPKDVRAATAPMQTLRRSSSSSIFLVMSPSHELSTEDPGSLIYVEKLDSVSKTKTIKLMPHENTQKLNPIKMFKRHTRVDEQAKHSVETGKCSGTRPVPASHKLPVTGAVTKCSWNKGATNRGKALEYSSLQFQNPRIPPKYSDNPKVTTVCLKGVSSKLPSCSTTGRLGVNPEQRIGHSDKQRIGHFKDTCPETTEPAHGSKDPLYKAITRYIHSTKHSPDQRLVSAENSKVCLISTTHSSKYRVPSTVSFSDGIKYTRRGKSSEPCEEKFLDPNSLKKRPYQGPNECKNSTDESSSCSSDEKAKRSRDKPPQPTLKISPKLSKISQKTAKGTRESKVRFDRPMNACCPCEKTASKKSNPCLTKVELRPCAQEKKDPKKTQIDCSKKEPKPCDRKEKNDIDQKKIESKQCKKKTSLQCRDTDQSNNESKPCEKKKSLSKSESNPCEKKAINSETIDQQPDLEPTCNTVAKELPEETKKNPRDLRSSGQTPTDKQSILTKECSSQCREAVKRATSPMNVAVKTVGIDGSSSSKSNCLVEKSNVVCPEKDKTPEKPLNICDRGSKDSFKAIENPCNRKKLTKTSTDKQPADENVEINRQTKSECSEPYWTRDSVIQPTNECVKRKMVSEQFCPPNSTPDSTAQPADVCVILNKQCPTNCTQDSIAQPPEENVKSSQQMGSECPANSIRNSVAEPTEDNAKLCQQKASECPADSTQKSMAQPCSENVKLSQQMASECPVETANEKDAPSLYIPCQNPVEHNNQTDTKDTDASGNKEKKHGRIWWCRKKKVLLRRRGDPAPRSIEENTMETQCERDVRDLAQMTDDLLLMTNDMMGTRGDPECLCGDNVKPCQCLHELAQSMRTGGAEITKPKSHCDCPPPILIIKGHQQQHYETDNHALKEQHSHCSCIAFLQNHNMIHRQHTIVNQNVTEIKGLGQMPEQQASKQALYIDNLKDPCHCPASGGSENIKWECPGPTAAVQMEAGQNGKGETCIVSCVVCSMMTDGDGKKNATCECPQSKATGKMAGGQNGTGGTRQGMVSGPGDKKNIICECPPPKPTGQTAGGQNGTGGTCQGMVSGPGDTKNITCECPPPKATGQMAGGQNGTGGTCQGMVSGPGDKKHASYECPRQRAIEHTAGGENGKVGTCQVMPSGPGGKNNVICECPPLKATDQGAGGQYGKDGKCLCMTPGPGGKIKVACECPPPKVTERVAGGQQGKDGACQCMRSGSGGKKNLKCECSPPTTIVKEQTTAIQCKKEQSSCDNLAKVESSQSKQSQDPNLKSGGYKKTVICENPSKDKLQMSIPMSGKAPCQNTACPKKLLNLSLRKKSRGQAEECTSSENCTECQNMKSRVKWCQKKYVISECPPLDLDKNLSSQKKKLFKKNAKNQAKIKTGEKKVDTSSTRGVYRCNKDEPLCQLKKNHKCECPCPLVVEEVDLNSENECPPVPPCPEDCPPRLPCLPKDEYEKNNLKKSAEECNQGQMTAEKIDKCTYTDRPIKNICQTKNKSSGQGKRAKKKTPPCCCPPEPSTTERGCDPPCMKEQWKMRSKETCSKSGFSVKKKPALRIDHTMCFEEALAYFEQHPEDDPMQQNKKNKKKKKTVLCECPPSDFCSSFGITRRTLPYCISRQY